MKKNIQLAAMLSAAVILICVLIPTFVLRVKNEAGNKNVILSLQYNDIFNKVSAEFLEAMLGDYLNAGINMVSVAEETMNSLVSRGDIVGLKYHDIRHKYDSETVNLEAALDNVPNINYDSYVFMAKRKEMVEFLDYWLPLRYTSDDYVRIDEIDGIVMYVFFDGTVKMWDIIVGFNTDSIAKLRGAGFNIALTLKINSYKKTLYLDETNKIIKDYGIRYLKAIGPTDEKENKYSKKNYRTLSYILEENNMTLVVNENPDQLSNQKVIGYDDIFYVGRKSVMRNYETHDVSGMDSTNYMFRYYQCLNSVIDRNIRFVTITQITKANTSYEKLAGYTFNAATQLREKLTSIGYSVNSSDAVTFDYDVNREFVSAVAAAATALIGMSLLMMLFDIKWRWYFALSFVLSILSFVGTFKIPYSLLLFYPTALAIILPCFVMTVFLIFVRRYRDSLPEIPFTVASVGVLLVLLCAVGFVMSALLSGINYYFNNDIFRGIKVSLFAPIIFTVIAYYILFVHKKNRIVRDIHTALTAKIEVYWLLIMTVLVCAAYIYIVRSGNVNKISAVETYIRRTVTELFYQRPRTKEYIIAYPCLILFLYYVKHTNLRLVQWVMAAGASILVASVTNTFCHVFTDTSTMYMRVVNGLLLGILTAAVAYIVNLIIVRIAKRLIILYKKEA
ncbi:MAG: DUF5693 family protein [Eubacteriales bacterium]|jgi:hypothetical protein|nr:hypothetical protein [Clostridiales bacterium]